MERKIGETFEYEGKKLKVVETEKNLCFDCYFYNGLNCQKTFRECGKCEKGARSDYKPIIFEEVKEESEEKPQKTEEIKERKVGEVFEYKGKKLQVKECAYSGCDGCFFDEQHIPCSKNVAGYCGSMFRTDKKKVIFVEITAEQPKEQAEQPKLNLCEILKYCPEDESFWSPLLGDVKFHDINQKRNFIVISLESGETWDINADGTITIGDVTSPEIMLYPGREQRDWTKVKYEPKKERFDPKSLQPFDRVLVRDSRDFSWNINIYSNKYNNKSHPYQCITSVYRYCIPYNDDTKHLVGTKEEAPDFYKYWED